MEDATNIKETTLRYNAVDFLIGVLELEGIEISPLYREKARQILKSELADCYEAGWMRANALNYDRSYFDYYWSNRYLKDSK